MRILRLFLLGPISAGCLLGSVGCSSSSIDPDTVAQVPFEGREWRVDRLERGKVGPRTRMKDDVIRRYPVGSRIEDVLEALGTPDLVESREQAEVSDSRRAPKARLWLRYEVFVGRDNWPLDVVMAFDSDGLLVRSYEAYR